jgi:hypothetical protein
MIIIFQQTLVISSQVPLSHTTYTISVHTSAFSSQILVISSHLTHHPLLFIQHLFHTSITSYYNYFIVNLFHTTFILFYIYFILNFLHIPISFQLITHCLYHLQYFTTQNSHLTSEYLFQSLLSHFLFTTYYFYHNQKLLHIFSFSTCLFHTTQLSATFIS